MSTTHAGHINEEWPFSRTTAPANTNHMELLATLAVIFIFILVCIHVYARFRQRHQSVVITIQRNRVPVMAPPHPDDEASMGLDPASIAALPTFIYRFGLSPAKNKPFEECAVCLSVPEEGEMMRMLPDCKHLFHIECIDMWLQSHSTCPVCRTTAKPPSPPPPPRKAELGELLASPPLEERMSSVEAVAREDGAGPSQSSRSETRGDGEGPSQGTTRETMEDGAGPLQGSRREAREAREAEDDHDVDLERQ